MATGKHSAKHAAPKKKKGGHGLIGVIVLVLIVLACGFVAQKVLPGLTEQPGQVAEGQEITIEVAEGSTTTQIAQLLKENGIIALESEFVNTVKNKGVADQLKAGTYRFIGGEKVSDIVDAMVKGNAGYTVTIPEGYSAKQIAKTVAAACELDEDEFYAQTLKADQYVADYPFLDGVYNNSMEGFLFPDTYTVSYGSTADQIVRMMLDNFSAQIASVDMSYAASKNLTTYDVVILASMTEKESRDDSDKASIVSVFYNRLHEGMSLGSDPTTYYAVGKDYTEPLTKQDLASDNPYNTRNVNNKGLPPGPICSPGMASLIAAAHPDETGYLFFFYSSKKDETMFFKDQASFDAAWAKLG